MKRCLAAFLGIIGIISIFSFSAPVYAVPVPPVCFSGTVTAGGVPVPDGTTVTAEIDGIQYAENITADGKYGVKPLFKIPTDDADTLKKEGWADGDQLDFYVNGVKADQTVVFENNEFESAHMPPYTLDLTVSYLATPTPTGTSTPTSTDMPTITPTGTPAGNITPTITTTPTPTHTPTRTPTMTSTPTASVTPHPTSPLSPPKTATPTPGDGLGGNWPLIGGIIGGVVVVVLAVSFLLLRHRAR